MRMRDDRQRETWGAVLSKEWSNDAAPRIVPVVPRPGVDQHPVPRRRAEQRRIPLTDIKKM